MEPDPTLTANVHELMPFTKVLGMEVVASSAEEVRARLAWAEERCTSNGIMHGGALMSMADAVGGMVALPRAGPPMAGYERDPDEGEEGDPKAPGRAARPATGRADLGHMTASLCPRPSFRGAMVSFSSAVRLSARADP